VGNSAFGGSGSSGPPYTSPGASGNGGSAFNANQASFINCLFSNNTATGGVGGSFEVGDQDPGDAGGAANGGALCNSGSLLASNNTFARNVATGGQGAQGASGIFSEDPVDYPPGNGGNGGNAAGGGVSCLGSSCILVNATFWSNSAVGGAGGQGGSGGDTGRYNYAGNGANGGSGGNGAGGSFSGQGGSLLAWNVTAALNSAAGGVGGAGGIEGDPPGTFYGGYPGSPGSAGLPGLGEGDCVGSMGGTVTLKNSIFSPNAPTDTNIFGSIIDAGNSISFDRQDSLTNSSSFNGINPMLAPLGNYGGPTPTMALLAGSPAIDHADSSDFPVTDQRGFPRPYGPAPDIGAFEYPPMNELILASHGDGQLTLAYAGTNGQTYRIQTSVDFMQWFPIATNTLGTTAYLDTTFTIANPPAQFFRAVSP
jgi:hypothetical protein